VTILLQIGILGARRGHPRRYPAGVAGADARGDPAAPAPSGDAAGLGAQLDEWAAELDAWAQQRRGLVELLEVVTRDQADRPQGEQLAALNRQLRAVLDQLQAMGEQVRAVRQQLAALQPAPGAPP
jgi:hypothetical protein